MTIVLLRSTLHRGHGAMSDASRKRGKADLVCFNCFECFQKQASLRCSRGLDLTLDSWERQCECGRRLNALFSTSALKVGTSLPGVHGHPPFFCFSRSFFGLKIRLSFVSLIAARGSNRGKWGQTKTARRDRCRVLRDCPSRQAVPAGPLDADDD